METKQNAIKPPMDQRVNQEIKKTTLRQIKMKTLLFKIYRMQQKQF